MVLLTYRGQNDMASANRIERCPVCGAQGTEITYRGPEGRLSTHGEHLEWANRGYKLLIGMGGQILNTVCSECHCLWHSASDTLPEPPHKVPAREIEPSFHC